MVGCIPLVMDAKELADKDSSWFDRLFHAIKYLVKKPLRKKRERKLGINEIISLEREILKRSLEDLSILLGKTSQ